MTTTSFDWRLFLGASTVALGAAVGGAPLFREKIGNWLADISNIHRWVSKSSDGTLVKVGEDALVRWDYELSLGPHSPTLSSEGRGSPALPSLRLFLLTAALTAAAMVWIGTAIARADAVEDFYKGKTVTVVTSTGVGGPFDLTARALARHMPRFIPGHPTMIVRNMPGGGHVLATNFMYNQAEKDGTVIATVNNSVPLHQVLDGRGVRYDARKFNWLGSTGTSNLLTVTWSTSGFKTVADVMARELVTGATGVGSGTFIYPNAMNVVLGTKFKIVMGYKSTPELDLALERGEVLARSGASLAGILQERASWIKENKVVVLTQIGDQREKDYPDVPLMQELAKTPEQRQILNLISLPPALGRPFFTAPGVPADRVAALRRAFEATMRDEAFLKEANELNLEMNPFGGDRVAAIVNETVNSPEEMLAKAKAVLEAPR
jgi:tripartite-type tricarboxylate transporter receptor subunit TctC